LFLKFQKMEKDIAIYHQTYHVRSVNINANKQLGLYGLLGILQDAATEHAYHMGFGYEEMLQQGFFWVLVRQSLKMDEWPNWHDEITISTWTKPIEGTQAIREFEIFSGDKKIGACSAAFMMLDIKTRMPRELTDTDRSFSPRTDYTVGFAANRIDLPGDTKPARSFEVLPSDLDMNNHVNNVKYSQWMLNLIPFEYHKEYKATAFDINFLSEMFLGDEITCHTNLTEESEKEAFFYGVNQRTGKKSFISRIEFEKR